MKGTISFSAVINRLFCLFIAGVLLSTIAPGNAHAQIVGLWRFDEGSGDVVKDSSGNGNDGKILGGEWVDGQIGDALQFNGTTDNGVIIEHKPNQDPSLAKHITVEAWVKVLSASSANVVRKGIWESGKATTGWGLDMNSDLSIRGFVYITAGSASLVAPGVPVLELEEWQHLAFVYDGKAVTVYVDGEEYGAVDASGELLENEEDMAIGIRPNLVSPFNGVIDEVVVWSVARTQDQIKQDMSGVSAAVEASGKLTTTWGAVKSSAQE